MALEEHRKELEKILFELHKLAAHRQQLSNRLSLLTVLKEFRQKAGYQIEAAEEDECRKIEAELKQLSERKLELQELQEKLDRAVPGDAFRVTQKQDPFSNEIFIVMRPPSYPAPQLITNMEKLPRHPALTQCPHCEQFITTEVSKVIGNTAWLMCLVCSLTCCIAGCCLVPFCLSRVKDVMHKCPKCRSHLHTCTSL